jgi:hypothetical protein
LLFTLKKKVTKFQQGVAKFLPDDTVSHLRRQTSNFALFLNTPAFSFPFRCLTNPEKMALKIAVFCHSLLRKTRHRILDESNSHSHRCEHMDLTK